MKSGLQSASEFMKAAERDRGKGHTSEPFWASGESPERNWTFQATELEVNQS